jgi:pimeloyl-ACP methyl ester carboxylesterase
MERARQQHGSADYRAAEGIMRQVLVRSVGETYEEQLAAIGCPVRLVWGDDDREVPLAVAERAAGLLAEAQVTVCPGAGHLTPLTVPGTLRAAVDELLG